MNELQQVIDRVTGHLARIEALTSATQILPSTVVLSLGEAQALVDAAQLVPLLQERCELLGRAVTAVWSLVSEEDQVAITAGLDVPAGSSKTAPAVAFAELRERFGDTFDAAWPNGFVSDEEAQP